MRDSGTNDLEIVLDKQNVEFPALVRERLISMSRDELSFNFATMSGGFCWLVSRHDLFVWKYEEIGQSQTTNRAVQLPLPTSGLIYCAKSIVVYQSGNSAGVLAVSGEGNSRHWPSISSARYTDSVLELEKEVVLSVELLEPPCAATNSGASFVLTTTSGSIVFLRSKKGTVSSVKVCGRDTKGIGRRLSSIIFGAAPSTTERSRVVNSLLFWRENMEMASGDSDDVVADPLVLTVSPKSLHVFDIRNKCLMWTVNGKDLLTDHVTTALERVSLGNEVTGVRIWLLDAASFREGILVLLCATHELSELSTFFLAHLQNCEREVPEVGWFSMVPMTSNLAQMFDIMDESSFVGRVSLCVPEETATSTSNDKTDGVMLVHAGYVQSVYVPNDLNRVNELPLNKLVSLPPSQKMIGHAVDTRYCFIMMSDGTVSTVRLLPKGFEDGSLDDVSFNEMLPDLPPGDEMLEKLRNAFSLFSKKDIVQASVQMQDFMGVQNHELAAIVIAFMESLIDQTDADAVPEEELRGKKVICNRFILFLKHMNVFDKVKEAKIVRRTQNKTRAGASILAEMCERVCVASALRPWQSISEEHEEALGLVSARIAKQNGLRGDVETVVLGKLLLVHQVPPSVVETSRTLLAKTKTLKDRIELLQIAADLMLTFATAIEMSRRSTSSVEVDVDEEKWTTGEVSEAFNHMCHLLLTEMADKTIGRTEKTRLRDCIVKLVLFQMEETIGKIDGHPVLLELYNLGEDKIALGLAERYKDFKVLCRICLEYDKKSRDELLNTYKLRFSSSSFDLYLCQYMQRKNLNEELLEQQGEQADRFLSSLDHMRWRRELQKKNYDKASHSLMGLADREENNIRRQKVLYSLAKLSSICADHPNAAVTEDATEKLRLIKHREAVPPHVIQLVYPDNPDQPLSAPELTELFRIAVDEEEALPETFLSAIHFLGALRSANDSAEAQKNLALVWSTAVARDDWSQVGSSDISSTLFGGLMGAVAAADWPNGVKKCCLPEKERLLKDSLQEQKLNKKLEKWIRRACDRASTDMTGSN